MVHGGPESQARPIFSAVRAALLAAGYGVVVPNVRGSTGYGKRYAALDDTTRRLDSVRDLAAVHGALAGAGFDPGRAILWGGSYGGYMVLAGLAFQPELWAAGVDIVGISNLVTFLENTSDYRRAHREREYGSLAHDRAFLTEASPLTHAEAIRAPLFVIHGRNDPRVPVGEAEQLVANLTARGVPCTLRIYEDEGHGLARLENQLDAYPAAIAFLDGVVGPRGVTRGRRDIRRGRSTRGDGSGDHKPMRFSINIPNFGDFADARAVATRGAAAEQAGWDGLLIWDHVVHDKRCGGPAVRRSVDAADRSRAGHLAPGARDPGDPGRAPAPGAARPPGGHPGRAQRRPGHLRGGLGGPIEDEFASFGDTTDAVVLAQRLDEGLELLCRYWAGETVNHEGEHYRVHDVQLLPATVQTPRPPIWIGGFWPARRPMRRAARWDGVAPLFATAKHGHIPAAADVRELVSYVERHRPAPAPRSRSCSAARPIRS